MPILRIATSRSVMAVRRAEATIGVPSQWTVLGVGVPLTGWVLHQSPFQGGLSRERLESKLKMLVRVGKGTFCRAEKSAKAFTNAGSYVSRTANPVPSRMAALVLANPSTISGHTLGLACPMLRKAKKAA